MSHTPTSSSTPVSETEPGGGTTAATPGIRRPGRGLRPRDLINIGIFSAIYFVVVFAAGMIGFIGPAASMAGFALGILLNGPVVALLQSRVRRFGTMTVFGVIVGLLMVLTGHYWVTVPIAAVLGLIGDLLMASRGFRSRWAALLAYGVFSLWYIGPILPMYTSPAAYHDYLTRSMNAEYADAWMRVFAAPVMAGFLVVAFGVALLGGWIGQRMLARHFERAGIAR